MFRSSKHEIHTIEVNKVALNRDDDKRTPRKDGISLHICERSQRFKLESYFRRIIPYLKTLKI